MNPRIFKVLLFLPFIIFYIAKFENISAQENINANDNNLFLKNKKGKKKEKLKIRYDDIKNILINNNVDLKRYKSRVNQSKALLKSNKAAWYPKINVSSDQLPNFVTGDSINESSNNTSTNRLSFGVSTTFEWDLINPSRRLNISLANQDLDNNNLRYEDRIDNLYFEAQKIFFEAQALSKEIEVAKEALNVSNFALNEAQSRFETGVGNKMEVLEANLQKEKDEIYLDQTIANFRKKRNSFSEILNLNEDFLIIRNPYSPLIGFWNFSYEESLEGYLNNSINLKIKENNLSMNKKQAKIKLSEKKPLVNLYNTFSVSSAKGESGVENPDTNKITKSNTNTLGLKFSLKIFDGGKIKEEYNSIFLKNKELESELDKEIISVTNDLRNSYIDLKINEKRIINYFSQLKSAKDSLYISLKRLEAGLTTQREVVNLQRDLKAAERNYITSISDYNILIAKLKNITKLQGNTSCDKKNENLQKMNKEFIEFLEINKILNCNIEKKS